MLKISKLNSRGAAHYAALMLVVVGVGIYGAYTVIASHADTATTPSNGPIVYASGMFQTPYANETDYSVTGNDGHTSMDYSWSPDGKKVAFFDRSATNTPLKVALTNNLGGQTLETPPSTALANSGPAWSPDGTRIAYVDANYDVHVYTIASNKDQIVDTTFHKADGISGVNWSHDSSHLVYSTSRDSGHDNKNEGVICTPLATTTTKSVACYNVITLASGVGYDPIPATPQYTSDDKAIVFSLETITNINAANENDHYDIDSINTDGTGQKTLLSQATESYVSPDGKLLAYVSCPDFNGPSNQCQNSGHLAIANIDGTHAVISTTQGYSDEGFNWQPIPAKATHTMGDFDGDSKSDFATYTPSTGLWGTSTAGKVMDNCTSTNSTLTPADYDGTGTADLSCFDATNGTWNIYAAFGDTTSNWGSLRVTIGKIGDIPVPCDYNGDGKTDIAIFRPSNGTWYVNDDSTSTRLYSQVLGANAGDIPVPGDYNGDGKTDIAIFRPSNGTWYVNDVKTGARLFTQVLGTNAGDVPVPGDYNGDGKTDIAIFRPSNGTWYVNDAKSGTRLFSQVLGTNKGDIPEPGDYNGDGKTDVAIYRPSNTTWYVNDVSSGARLYTTVYGQKGDVPLELPYAIRHAFGY